MKITPEYARSLLLRTLRAAKAPADVLERAQRGTPEATRSLDLLHARMRFLRHEDAFGAPIADCVWDLSEQDPDLTTRALEAYNRRLGVA